MRIAHIVSAFPPRIGGMGEVCLEEAARLAEIGHKVTVFTMLYNNFSRSSSINIESNRDKLFDIIRMRPLIRKGDGGWMPQLFFKLKNFDLIHLHFPFYVSAHCVLLAKRFRKQKYVVTYHMDAQTADFGKKIVQKIYDYIFTKKILANAEKIIAVDKDYFQNSKYRKFVDSKKIIEITNGIDAEMFKPIIRDKPNANLIIGRKKYILFVGNLMPVKRLDLLFRAVKLINDENVLLLVVGGGYDEEKYKKMAKELDIINRVKFIGACVDKQKLVEYYNISWCTAVPSASESFSLVALESLACGCPVIAQNIPGIRERIKNGIDGWLVDNDNPNIWAKKLNKILNLSNEERERMGEAGRQKVLNFQTWNEHVKKLEIVYNNAIM